MYDLEGVPSQSTAIQSIPFLLLFLLLHILLTSNANHFLKRKVLPIVSMSLLPFYT